MTREMIELGKYNVLKVLRRTTVGLFLGDAEGNEVLLPNKFIENKIISIDDEITVFIYKDSEDRLIASTDTPKILVNEFAYLFVTDVNQNGAFLDWGMERDLFVPFREQGKKMEEDRCYMVYMYLDEKSDRLVASSKINRFLDNANHTFEEGDEVDIMIWDVTTLGVSVIINKRYKGLIFHNDIFTHLAIGETRKAYIKTVREDDQLDVILQKPGYDAVEPNAQLILERLKNSDGFLALTDKSDPNLIYRELEMSKKLFKKAIGTLYRRKLITLEEEGVRLIKKD
ncbi:MAG: S1-like domain-containing RNA-binding protein [Bacteroidales bacterium]|nr:S1-like domain-containing RNA-binding protein [Bacteroidales bacterium]